MKIVSSAVTMQSQHYAMLRTEEQESLRVSITAPPRDTPPTSAPAPTPPAGEAAQGGKTGEGLDWRLLLIKSFIEWLTGKPIVLFDASQLSAPGSGDAAPAASAVPATPAAPRAAIGIEYEYHASRDEVELSDFGAQGSVTTADGRRIDFAVDIEMLRRYSERTDVSLRAGDAARRKDPLVVNLGGSAVQLSTERMNFDLDADGKAEAVPLLAGGSAFLALDRNGNGRIDSGAELFGPATGSGFAELAKYDADHNGWIDENDPVFQQLRLWKPAASGDGELTSLMDGNLGAVYLGHQDTPFELRGARNEDLGAVRSSGIYLSETGQAGSIQQIDLTV